MASAAAAPRRPADSTPSRPVRVSTRTPSRRSSAMRSGHLKSPGKFAGDDRRRTISSGVPAPMPAHVTNFSSAGGYVDSDADDLALVIRCRGGDTAAFEDLVVRYQRVLFTVALRMLGN